MLNTLTEKHGQTLNAAVQANINRGYYAHWQEMPSPKIYGETANEDGQNAFRARLNTPFTGLLQDGASGTVGEEISPYGFPLGISYPAFSAETLVANAQAAWKSWRELSPLERAAVLIESLESAAQNFFEIGYATMHTTGQGFMMSFQASGPHAFDRALEAVAMGYSALTQHNPATEWVKPMGKMNITVQKKFHAVPKGIGVVVGCSTFPTWNSTPGIFANLITGNPTIVKPHPKAVLPIAIVVASIQQTLSALGLNPHIIQLAADSSEEPNTLALARHSAVRIIDYTGASAFGNVLETIAHEHGKTIFTEKAGVNPVIIESVQNLDAALDNVSFSLSLYSGQMCTAPQNIFINKNGVRQGENLIPFEEVCERLAGKISALMANEKAAPSTAGALQNPLTAERVQSAEKIGIKVLRPSAEVAQPGFENARTSSPLLLLAENADSEIFSKEWFGPISFVIPTENFEESLDVVCKEIKKHGALSTLVYTTDDDQKSQAEERIVFECHAPLALNFTGPIWVNQSAAFSDFHGTGANLAGNASFADSAFVANRFAMIGVREVK